MIDQQKIDGIWIGPVKYPVWREKTEVTQYDGGISMIDNPEIDKIKAPLVETILKKMPSSA